MEKQAEKPEVLHVEFADLRAALAEGWADFRRAPLFGFASVSYTHLDVYKRQPI